MDATVLIVDDHPTFRRFARRLLEQEGFAVVGEAADGATAVEAAQALRPEIVLLDILLGDASGLEIAVALAAARHVPAVVLTSSRAASDFGVALDDAPALGFIAKADLTGRAFAELVAGA